MSKIDKYKVYEDGYFKGNLELLKEYCKKNRMSFDYGGDHSNNTRLWVKIGHSLFITTKKDRDDSTADIIEYINNDGETGLKTYNLDYMETIDDEYKYEEARKNPNFFSNRKSIGVENE